MRRLRLAIIAAASACLVLGGCTTGPSNATRGSDASPSGASPGATAFPVTIGHAFGSTTIAKEPTRVVTLGWSDADHVAALGVAPVGAPKVTWGGNGNLSTDWFDAQLATFEGAAPTRFDDADGNPIEEIAKLRPDLVLATNSGITKDEYDKLSKLAPVIAYPDLPYGTSWQDSLDIIAKALGRSGAATEVKAKTLATLEAATARYPQIAGKTFIYAYLAAADLSQVGYYTPSDLRPQMLTELGLRNAPIIETLAKDSKEFYRTVSAEQAKTLEADIILTYITEDSEVATFTKDPLIGQIPAVKSGAIVATKDQKVGLTMSSPTPLSIPHMTELFVPLVAAAADKAAAAS